MPSCAGWKRSAARVPWSRPPAKTNRRLFPRRLLRHRRRLRLRRSAKMAVTLEGFHKSLGKGELAPVYLIASEEPLLLQETADALRARARALGFGEREVLDVEARFDWNELARAGAGLSLFATKRLIELRLPTGLVGKEGSAAIVEWCKSAAPDTVLLILAAEW